MSGNLILWAASTEVDDTVTPSVVSGEVDCELSAEIEWTAELAANTLGAVMEALAELPVDPMAFQQAILAAMARAGEPGNDVV